MGIEIVHVSNVSTLLYREHAGDMRDRFKFINGLSTNTSGWTSLSV